MSWHQINIDASDVADADAKALMNAINKAYRDAGVPDGVEVYHRAVADGGPHVYLLNPAAARLAPGVLQDYRALPVPPPASLEGFRAVRL